jgi:hypothetical protein
MELAKFADSPPSPGRYQDFIDNPQWRGALEKGQQLLKL